MASLQHPILRLSWIVAILTAVSVIGTESGPSSAADTSVMDLGDQDPIPAAYTRTCLADESCTRELFLDMTLGNRFDVESNYAGFVLKWSGPVVLLTEFADMASGQIADDVASAVIGAADAAGLSLIRGPADQGVGGGRIYIIGSAMADEKFSEGNGGENQDDLFRVLLDEALAQNEAAPHDACIMALRGETESRNLLGALVLVKTDWDGEAIRKCIGIRLLQSMGLVSDLELLGFDSVMSEGVSLLSKENPIGAMDRMMLSLLYDPSIEFGMTRDQILDIFPEVYARHKPSGPVVTLAVPEELIDPVDDTTLECMATLWCAEEMFLQMAVTGSEIEPIAADQQMIKKKILPATVSLVLGSTVGEPQKEAAHRGLDAALRLASRVGLPVLPLDGEHASPSRSNTIVFVTGDLDKDKADNFAPWLTGTAAARIFSNLERQFAPHVCRGIFRRWGNGLGIWLDMALLPGAADVAPSLVERCVIEEFLQGFGLTADLTTGVQTLFDDRPDNQKPTGFDLFMLALLDHPTIRPGMTSDEVKSVFGQVHADVWSVFKADTWWLKGADINQLPDDL